MTTHGMTPYHPNPHLRDHSASPGLAGSVPIGTVASLRCSVVLVRDDEVLLVPHGHNWVLPGGPVRPRETLTDCVRRETGLPVDIARCLLVHEQVGAPIELVFAATCDPAIQPAAPAQFFPLSALPATRLRPPVVAELPTDTAATSAAYVRLGRVV